MLTTKQRTTVNYLNPTPQAHTFASRTKPSHRPKLAKECACANAQPTDNKSHREKGQQITGVLRNGGRSASYETFH